LAAFNLRLGLEREWLRRHGVSEGCAMLAAARAAAMFIGGEADRLDAHALAALPAWVAMMAAEKLPSAAAMAAHFTADAAEIALVRQVWQQLGTVDALMETGGDIRLARDPQSALNGYGCSHRPRPWAITFASSTASSSSSRGYVAADRARLRHTLALLRGATRRDASLDTLARVRRGIKRYFGLARGTQIVLAASGTDTELLALALAHMEGGGQSVRSVLIAPEETGRGVPAAAAGRHFAVDTARGHDVVFQAPIAGFRADTDVKAIALRDDAGAVRPMAVVEAEIIAAVGQGIYEGWRVVLHALDLSKTGLLAPTPSFLAGLRARFGGAFDLVVDACQTRLSPASLRAYLALDAVVLVTGSKFFTGPPFAGAAILPPRIAKRLRGATLPAGLEAYFGRDEFPEQCPAAQGLPPAGNYGLALRWCAALAEMRGFARTDAQARVAILERFGDVVRAAVARMPALALLAAPPINRAAAQDWECLPSIFSFSIRAPHEPARNLTPDEARAVYRWLNADLSAVIPHKAALARRICHIGQPVPLPQPDAGLQGVLRVSAGARLFSGEPSHRALRGQARLAREFADLTLVFDKIGLILAHWEALCAADPKPCYRPGTRSGGKT
ncbi:MAG: hypothetical protein POH28_16020, partial [Acidocella sp.]|nr:hypothetical protein [Acidocella sp.]